MWFFLLWVVVGMVFHVEQGIAGPKRAGAPPKVKVSMPAQPIMLQWENPGEVPDIFTIRRRLNGAEWKDIESIPGEQGAEIQWSDGTLHAKDISSVAEYEVFAVKGGAISKASNKVTTTVGGGGESPPAGTCTLTQVRPKSLTIKCTTK